MNTYNQDIKDLWKSIQDQTAEDMASYCILRALRSRKNDRVAIARGLLLTAFTPITKTTKLLNGSKPFQALDHALWFVSNKYRTDTVYRKKSKDFFGSFFGSHLLNDYEWERYGKLLEDVRVVPFEDTTYAYIFVAQDMSREQQLVQAAHVTMALGQNVSKREHNAHGLSFVIFGVPDQHSLFKKWEACLKYGFDGVYFREPDMENRVTAFALNPMRKSRAIRSRLFDDDTLLTLSNDNSKSIDHNESPDSPIA